MEKKDALWRLREWVKRQGTLKKAADQLGMSEPGLCMILNGTRGVGLKTAASIERVIKQRDLKIKAVEWGK